MGMVAGGLVKLGVGKGQGAAWTPASPTSGGGVSPHVWYDADQITGLSDGDAVATWPDIGPNGDDVTQGTPAARPLYKTSILNGKPVVRFDGSDDYLQGALTNAGATTQPATIFAVAQLDATVLDDGATRPIIDGDDSGHRTLLYKSGIPSPDSWGIYAGTALYGSAGDSDTNIWCALFNGASSQFWLNGISEASGDAGSRALDGITIGALYDGARPWKGDIAEIIVYDAGLSNADKNEVGSYLATKYGLSWTDI